MSNSFQFNTEDGLNVKVFVKKSNGKVSGISSLTEDGFHIFMADWDKVDKKLMEFELKAMQKAYDLGPIFILESSPKHYHSLSFVKLTYQELKEILNQIDCDNSYSKAKTLILRTSEKNKFQPKIIKILIRNSKRIGSLAHLLHYRKYIDERIEVPGLIFDKNKKLMKVTYET